MLEAPPADEADAEKQRELGRRQQLGIPPTAALGLVSGVGAAEFVGGLALAGVQSAPTAESGFMLRAPSWDALGQAIADTPRPKASRLRIQIDPPRL